MAVDGVSRGRRRPAVQPDVRSRRPGNPIAGEAYTIRKKDTMWKLAQKVYGDGSKWTAIRDANPGINPNKLKIGAKLNLPSLDDAKGSSSFSGKEKTKPPVDLGAGASIAQMQQARDPDIRAFGPDADLATKADAGGNKDGKVSLGELQQLGGSIIQQIQELAAKPTVTQKEIQTGEKLIADYKRLTEVVSVTQEVTQSMEQFGALADKIDNVVKDSATGKRIGNSDGQLTRTELEAFIKDREVRAKAMEREGQPQIAQEERMLAEIAKQMRAIVPG